MNLYQKINKTSITDLTPHGVDLPPFPNKHSYIATAATDSRILYGVN